MKRRGALALASALALSLGLAGCSNGADGSSAENADSNGIITVNTVEP